jgi:hypothetical protein
MTDMGHDPCFTESEEDQLLMYHGTRKQRKAAKARVKEREQRRAERHRALRPRAAQPQVSEPRELRDSEAMELGDEAQPRRGLFRRRTAK